MIESAQEFLVLNPSDWNNDIVRDVSAVRSAPVSMVFIDLYPETPGSEPSFLQSLASYANEQRMCSVCHGQKVYYRCDGVGMFEEHDCSSCKGSGIESDKIVSEWSPF